MMSLSGSRGRDVERQHNRRPWSSLLVVLTAILPLSAELRAEWFDATRALMGTEVRVRLWHPVEEEGAALAGAVFAEIARIEALMSTYIEDSAISRVNREAAAGPVPAGGELSELVQRALDVSLLTRGAFDITYDSVGRHYDFRAGRQPDAATLARELPAIDYRLVSVDEAAGTIAFAGDGVRINLGGIAKGYAVERGVAVLREHGVRHAIVTAGGDSRLLGDRRGQPWVVGIRDPRDDTRVALRLPLVDEAISTSGDYERFFEEEGRRIHHILEPATGEPATGVRSATVIGPDGVLTDALSTSVFVMGVDRGLRLLGTLPDYEGIVIDGEGRLYYSQGLQPPP